NSPLQDGGLVIYKKIGDDDKVWAGFAHIVNEGRLMRSEEEPMNRWKAILYLLLSSLLWAFPSPRLFGQTTTGTIRGVVTDASQGALPGATVTATSINTGISHTVFTDAAGRYALLNLPAALYKIQAELPGFVPTERSRITLEVAQTLNIDFTLKVAGGE